MSSDGRVQLGTANVQWTVTTGKRLHAIFVRDSVREAVFVDTKDCLVSFGCTQCHTVCSIAFIRTDCRSINLLKGISTPVELVCTVTYLQLHLDPQVV